jgi:hypothetical protein
MKSRQNFYWINGSKKSRIIFILYFDYEKIDDIIPHLKHNLHTILLWLYKDLEDSGTAFTLNQRSETHVKEDKATNDFFPSTSGFSNNMKS